MFLIEIPVLGTTAPDWSVTVPESVAPVTWAETGIRIMGLNARAANAIKLAAIFVGRISENMVASQSRNTRAFGYSRDVRTHKDGSPLTLRAGPRAPLDKP